MVNTIKPYSKGAKMLVKTINENEEQTFLKLNEEFYGSQATKRGYEEALSLKTFHQLISKHENLWGYFIYEDQGVEPIGYALISSYWCNEEGGNIIILDELYINPKFRHHGYGTHFLKWLEVEFKGKATSITLEVLSTNTAAKELYAKDGLTEDGFVTLTKNI